MNPRHWFLVCLAFCLAFFPAATAAAQPAAKLSPSHQILDNAPTDPAAAEQLLSRRLRAGQEMQDLDRAVAKVLKGFDPNKLTAEDLQKLQALAKQQQGKPVDLNK